MTNEIITRDIKKETIEGLAWIKEQIESGVPQREGLEHPRNLYGLPAFEVPLRKALYGLSELIDNLSSSTVKIEYSRPANVNTMPVCHNTEDLIANNID